MKISCVDLYCGIGGLTAGIERSGIEVIAGLDLDQSCKWSYEKNTNSKFLSVDIAEISPIEIADLFPKDTIRLLAGCAPLPAVF